MTRHVSAAEPKAEVCWQCEDTLKQVKAAEKGGQREAMVVLLREAERKALRVVDEMDPKYARAWLILAKISWYFGDETALKERVDAIRGLGDEDATGTAEWLLANSHPSPVSAQSAQPPRGAQPRNVPPNDARREGALASPRTVAPACALGLCPGKSTRADAERILGVATQDGGRLRFDGSRFEAEDIVVRLVPEAEIVDSITITPLSPPAEAEALNWFGESKSVAQWDQGDAQFVVLLPAQVMLKLEGGAVSELSYLSRRGTARELRRAATALAPYQPDEAIAALGDLISLHPRDADPYFALAALLHAEGRDKAALAVADLGLAILPHSEDGALLRSYVEASLASRPQLGWFGAQFIGGTVGVVVPGTPAAEARLQPGDVVKSIGGSVVATPPAATRLLQEVVPGQRVTLQMSRGGETRDYELKAIDALTLYEGAQRTDLEERDAEQMVVLMGAARAGGRFAGIEDASGMPPELLPAIAQMAECLGPDEGCVVWQAVIDATEADTDTQWRGHASTAMVRLQALRADLADARKTLEDDEPRAALQALDAVSASDPEGRAECGTYFELRGRCYLGLRDYMQAVEALDRAARWCSDSKAAWSLLAQAYSACDLQAARAAANMAASRCPEGRRAEPVRPEATKTRLERAIARMCRGDAWAEVGSYSEAVAQYDLSAAAVPHSVELLMRRAKCYVELGQTDKARELLALAGNVGETPLDTRVRAALLSLGGGTEEADDGTRAARALPVTGHIAPGLRQLDVAVTDFMGVVEAHSAVLAVARGGKIVAERGYGWVDEGRTRPTPPDTMMRIAGLTKCVTAAATRKLIRDGRVGANMPVFPLLGVEPMGGEYGDSRLRAVTVQHLIDHGGGWDRDQAFDPMFDASRIGREMGLDRQVSPEDVVAYMLAQPLQFAPGETDVYSNFGYCALGRLIEKVTGTSYIEHVRESLLDPADIGDMALAATGPARRHSREVWYAAVAQDTNMEVRDSSGGLVTSAPAFLRFMQGYWLSGEPREPGQTEWWHHWGYLPGSLATAIQNRDGVDIALLISTGRGESAEEREMLDQAIRAAVTKGRVPRR